MPDARLERARRAYDRVIDLGPYGCKLLMVGEQDTQALNALWNRDAKAALQFHPDAFAMTVAALGWRAPHLNDAEQLKRKAYLTDCDPGDEIT